MKIPDCLCSNAALPEKAKVFICQHDIKVLWTLATFCLLVINIFY
jgi:hypothetical protein